MCSITALSFFVAVISAHAADIMKAFPPAEEGMVRYVLQLAKQDDETIYDKKKYNCPKCKGKKVKQQISSFQTVTSKKS
jgi:serine protease inhibitor ecotin